MSIVLVGSTSGSCTLQEQAVAGTTVLTLPTVSGTILTTTSPKAGNVIQVVNATYATQTTTTSTSFVTSGLTGSITPTSSTSKILALATFVAYNSTGGLSSYYTLYRNSTNLFSADGAFRLEIGGGSLMGSGVISYLDSPATTSSTTYTVYMKSQTSGNTTYMALSNITCVITLMEIAA